MTVVIVDCGSGNLRSAAKAFERVAASGRVVVSDDAAAVRAADRVVLPGVGAFADCKAGLAARPGLIEALDDAVIRHGRPFLGICVGMQLMAARGREHGVHAGLGWIAGEVVRLAPDDPALKVPHMGWNELDVARDSHPLLENIESGEHMYFVHGYHLRCDDDAVVLATADYGEPVTAAVARDNLAGVQFHPEKSQAAGLKLIANFLRWTP